MRITQRLTDAEADALRATRPDESHYDRVITGDCTILRPDGTPLLVFRRRVLPAAVCAAAYRPLLRAAKPTDNRGDAAGGGRQAGVRKDGTPSNTVRARPILSTPIGYLDRDPRHPFCRATSYAGGDLAEWRKIVPLVRAADGVFRDGAPGRYAAQLAAVARTPPEYVIAGTVFTTLTVNRNLATAYHKDKADLPEGFGVVTVIRAGEYSGGLLVFPKYGVAVDLRSQDVLLADVHEWHGNTAIDGRPGEYERVACVMYYRRRMADCLPGWGELHQAKRRRPGDPLGPDPERRLN